MEWGSASWSYLTISTFSYDCPTHWHGCSIRLLEINLAAVRNLISVLVISPTDRYDELFQSSTSPLLYFRSKVPRIVPRVYELPKMLVTIHNICFRLSFPLSSIGIGTRTLSPTLIAGSFLAVSESILSAWRFCSRWAVKRVSFRGSCVDNWNWNKSNVTLILLSLGKVFWSNLYVL